jgi:plasmid maintenance system antidote protein VapI/Zn-dependent peptidase ImmA (M78 family)
MTEATQFLPDWASPPGATIGDILQERGQSIAEFARAMHDSVDHIQQLLVGSAAIDRDVADHLAAAFGMSANFWLAREAQFRDGLRRLAKNEEWLESLPFNDLTRFRWIRSASTVTEKIGACLEFFGVATVADWRRRYEEAGPLAAFRTSSTFASNDGATLAWLRKGEIEADKIHCEIWNPDRFRAILPEIRVLTREKNPAAFVPALQRMCAQGGVAVVVARAPSGCRASGATRFLDEEQPLLMLSFRYLSDDHFWFTFFHEAGHLMLHDRRALFLEDGVLCSGHEEEEANDFAAGQLVPVEHQAEMRKLPVDGRAVMRFARKIGVSPGIVVGQLQHLKIFDRRQLNNLKARFAWVDD